MSMDLKKQDALLAAKLSRRSLLKTSALLGAGSLGMGLLAACGSDDDADDTDSTDGGGGGSASEPTTASSEPTQAESEPTSAAADETEETDEAEPTEAAGGGERTSMVEGVSTEPIEMDPHKGTATVDRGITDTMYVGLTRWDLEMNPEPEIAEKWEIVDDHTWVFDIRQGVMFHHGREVSAEDIKFSIDRIIELGAAGKLASTIPDVESVDVLGDYQVQFNLSASSGTLLNNLVSLVIVPSDASDGDSLSSQPVGAGPYKWVERIPNQHIKVEKFEDYWRTDLKYADELTIIPTPEAQTAIADLKTNNVDYLDNVPPSFAEELENTPGIQLVEPRPGSAGFTYTLMQNNRAPFDDVNARLAVAYAMDREALLKAVYFGRGEAGWNPFPKAHWAYAPDVEGPDFDLDKAKEHLEMSSYNGEEIVYKIFPTGVWPQFGQLVQAMLQEAGFNIKLQQIEFASWIEEVYTNHDFQIAQTSLTREWDADGFIISALYTGGGNNPGEYSSPEMDAALDRGRQETDIEARKEAYKEVQRLYAQDMPHVKGVNTNSVGAFNDKKVAEMNRNPKGLVNWGEVVMK